MTIPLICLLGGVLLPYIWAGASVPFRNRQFGALDLKQPRVQADQLVDAGAWAVGAQMNAWEAITVFGVANLAAYMAGVDPAGVWSTWAMVWLAARAIHGVAYIAGIAVLRVACFVLGLACSLALFWLALSA